MIRNQITSSNPLVEQHKDSIMLQGFNWVSSKDKGWLSKVGQQSQIIAISGVDLVWLPPVHESLSPQGYMPKDYFNFNSAYGNEHDLRETIDKLHQVNVEVLADIVVNHRCSNAQDSEGKWTLFKCSRGIMDWDAYCINESAQFGMKGHKKSQDLGSFDAAPNVDHLNQKVQRDITTYLKFMREDMHFDGFRLDFVKGYQAEIAGQYLRDSHPKFAVGEYWDALNYDGNRPKTNQDEHRNRTIQWIEKTGKRSTAFDFTTKGCLQEALRWSRYKLLVDANNQPQGVIGKLPGYAVTFVDNHDTGSEQGHWPFSNENIDMGYAYLLTHPGIPCIFWDHLFDWKYSEHIRKLTFYRKEFGINSLSKVDIKQADNDRYIAIIDDKVCLILGSLQLDPNSPKDQQKYVKDENILKVPGEYADQFKEVMVEDLWALYARK